MPYISSLNITSPFTKNKDRFDWRNCLRTPEEQRAFDQKHFTFDENGEIMGPRMPPGEYDKIDAEGFYVVEDDDWDRPLVIEIPEGLRSAVEREKGTPLGS